MIYNYKEKKVIHTNVFNWNNDSFQDDQIAHERTIYRIAGGCTAVAAIFFLGKLYVANAGDSR